MLVLTLIRLKLLIMKMVVLFLILHLSSMFISRMKRLISSRLIMLKNMRNLIKINNKDKLLFSKVLEIFWNKIIICSNMVLCNILGNNLSRFYKLWNLKNCLILRFSNTNLVEIISIYWLIMYLILLWNVMDLLLMRVVIILKLIIILSKVILILLLIIHLMILYWIYMSLVILIVIVNILMLMDLMFIMVMLLLLKV